MKSKILAGFVCFASLIIAFNAHAEEHPAPAAASPIDTKAERTEDKCCDCNTSRKLYAGFLDGKLYAGLSIGYALQTNGGMIAEYANYHDSWYVPGSFKRSAFQANDIMPVQISVGTTLGKDYRADLSFLRYSGISYPGIVKTLDDDGGYIDVRATDGDIKSVAAMLNVYYNLDSYTGRFANGKLSPYVGAGIGIARNTIRDYLVYDWRFHSEPGICDGMTPPEGTLTGVKDIYANHSGGTTEGLAYALEGGVSSELGHGLELDFFLRWANLGRVKPTAG